MPEMTVPLVSRGNGLWGSPSPAWDHLINRESSGRPTVIQSPSVVDGNTGGNEAEGLFQITPKCVPLDSQIVTRRGILRHDEVTVGDQTIGYNPQTGRSEWTDVLEVCHFDAAPVYRVGRGKWSAECTVNHRWVTLRPQRPESFTSCPHCGWSGNPRTGIAATPRSVSTHMGRVHGVKQGDIAWKGRFDLVESHRLTPHHSILLAAAAETGRELPISEQEAAIVGWIVSDGHIRKAGNSYSASIWQSKPEQVVHLEELLRDVPHGRSARWTKLSKIGPSHTFRLSQPWITELVKRADLDITNIAGFVLRLSPSQRSAFLDAVVRAEGHTRDGLTRIAQAEGDKQDAIALAVYLAGYHPSFTPLSGKSNLTPNPRLAHQVGMSRPYRTSVAVTPTGRVEPVWCVRTGLGTWTMRQGKRIMLTGNTWRGANGQQFAPSARAASPQQQAIVAARIFTKNPTGSDWGAGRPGRENPQELAAGLVRLTSNQQENPMTVSGDPVWLEDVLREALGDRLVVEPGWKDRGAGGTMGVIWGTMIHHTGNVNESVAVIRDGVQQPSGWLPGPLSQGLIKPDGTLHLIAVGPCNHAGAGNWGTLTDGNRQAIGFECAYSGSGPWPQKQIITMRDAAAAISKHIGKKAADSVCGHKEYAKPQGRKPDPGNMDMDWFRGEVQKDLDGFIFPGEVLTTVPPAGPQPKRFPDDWTDRDLLIETLRQLRGFTLQGWEQLGGRSLVDAVAELLKRDAA